MDYREKPTERRTENSFRTRVYNDAIRNVSTIARVRFGNVLPRLLRDTGTVVPARQKI